MKDTPAPRAPSPYPRWLSWVFVLFLVYILYQGNFGASHDHRPVASDKPAAPAHTSEYPALRALTDKDRWQRAVDPQYVGATTWKDVKPGEGKGADCGDAITVKLRGTLEDGANFDPSHKEDAPVAFTLGHAPYKALDNALLGLRPGGARQVTAPPQLVYKEGVNRTRESIILYVERIDAGSSVPADTGQLKLKSVEDQSGHGAGVACGAPVAVSVTVWNDKGMPAYKTPAPVQLTLGAREVSSMLDASLVGLAPGGSRTLLLPPGTLSPAQSVPAALRPLHGALDKPHLVLLTVSRAE